MKTSERKFGALLSYIIIGLNMLVGLAYTPILTAKLGQSEYGLYSLITSIISYLAILDCGLGNTIIIYNSKYMKNNNEKGLNKLNGMFLTIYTIIGIVTTLIGVILYFNASSLFNQSVSKEEIELARQLIIVLIINMAITFPGAVFNNIIAANEKFIYQKLLMIITIILKPVIMIPLLFLGQRSLTLVIVITVINIFSIISNILFCKKKLHSKFSFKGWDFKVLKGVFAFSFWIALQEIVDKVNWSIDNFLLGKLSGTVAVSVYAVASQLNQIYISTSTAISGVLLPKIARISTENEENKKEKMTDIMIRTGRIQLFVVGLILSGFIIFGKSFILLWVGESYLEAYYIGCALMIPMLVSLIQNVGTGIMQSENKHKFLSVVFAIMAILNIIISIPLIKSFGGIGAALGTGISLIIGNVIIKNIYYQKVLKLNIIKFFGNIKWILLFLFIISVLGYNIMNTYYMAINSWTKLILVIAFFAMFYCIVSYCFFMNKEEKDEIKNFIKRGKEWIKIK